MARILAIICRLQSWILISPWILPWKDVLYTGWMSIIHCLLLNHARLLLWFGQRLITIVSSLDPVWLLGCVVDRARISIVVNVLSRLLFLLGKHCDDSTIVSLIVRITLGLRYISQLLQTLGITSIWVYLVHGIAIRLLWECCLFKLILA